VSAAPFSVLLTSGGRRVALVREFQAALKNLGVAGRVLVADLRRNAAAFHAADAGVLVPRVSSPEYVPHLLELCAREGVRMVVPLIDTELHLLAPHREAFAARGITLVVSSPATTELSLDKRTTRDFFVAHGFDTPRVLDAAAILADPAARYPYFLKPADGSCSVGATRVDDAESLAFHARHTANAMVQEFVQGAEYTLDVLADFTGKVRCVVPRLRIETRAGEVSKGMTVKDPLLMDAGRRVVEALPGAVGCMTVQLFLTAERAVKFIEINPRFGGGFPLAAAAGAKYPEWLVAWALGRDPAVSMDGWTDGLVMLRYDDAVFVQRDQIG
jgi:carbamoyl-phosphate synthase large subunit